MAPVPAGIESQYWLSALSNGLLQPGPRRVDEPTREQTMKEQLIMRSARWRERVSYAPSHGHLEVRRMLADKSTHPSGARTASVPTATSAGAGERCALCGTRVRSHSGARAAVCASGRWLIRRRCLRGVRAGHLVGGRARPCARVTCPRRSPSLPMLALLGALAALCRVDGAQPGLDAKRRAHDRGAGTFTRLSRACRAPVVWRSTATRGDRPLRALASARLLVCVVAVGSRLDPTVFGHDQIDAVYHIDRLSYPFGYWNSVAAWGAMCTALGLIWSAHDRFTAGAGRSRSRSCPSPGSTTYLTYSRGGLFGGALALVGGTRAEPQSDSPRSSTPRLLPPAPR